MDKVWLLYGHYRYAASEEVIKAWDHPPSDEDQNQVKIIGGFDGYKLKEMEVTTKETKE